jgi:hypothetical protein
MAVPVIDTTTSVLGFRQGEAFIYQPAATNTPTSWTWTNLPPGVSANGTTGRLTGPATAAGVFLATVTATNGTGTSTPLVVTFGIFGPAIANGGAVPVNIDLRTGRAYPPSIADWKPGDPVIWAKNGDTFLLDVGFTADGGTALAMVDPATVRISIKETENQSALELSDGAFETVGEWDTTRYRIKASLPAAAVLRALRNYEADSGTFFDALCEIEWTQAVTFDGDATTLVRSTQTFPVRLARELAPAA